MTSTKHDFTLGGFRFRVLDEDYDYCHAKSVRYKFHKNTWKRALAFKEQHEHDFWRCEYDCTGSTQVRIKLKRKGKYMFVYYHWSKDV